VRRIYSCLIGLFAPLLFLVFIWRYGLRRTLRGMGERWGKGRPPDSRRRVWFHAASVGEIRALEPLLRGFRRRFPDIERLVTTTSVAGKELAARLDLADMVRLAPLDLENCVRRFLRSWTPRAAVFIETELWPNWIASAADAGVPLLLVNGRMSDRTSGIYRRTRFFWAPLFERFFRLGVQSPLNAERFRAAGASSEKIAVTGNLKYDVPLPDSASRPVLFRRYGFRESDGNYFRLRTAP
jgi:3-deoxy-D-manno-octulosonic-acid transferase